jgi:D-sedoheptulose 7-phosphate isomerase
LKGLIDLNKEQTENQINEYLQKSAVTLQLHAQKNTKIIADIAEVIIQCLNNKGKLLIMGNGGSAADAQHIAAELVGRYLLPERRPLPVIALTVNTSTLTAVGNDFGYDAVFIRQIQAFASPGDAVLAISTSGNSVNINIALEEATKLGLSTLGFSGKGGGAMVGLCQHCMTVPSDFTPNIQEAHIASGHILCGLIEEGLA